MAKTVVGLFDRFEEAQNVVQDLTNSGVSQDDISVVANDASGQYKNYDTGKMDRTEGEQAASGAVAGAGTGAAVGLLVGLGALAIPGIGPVIAAGPLAAALGAAGATVAGSTAIGAGLGAASGGLIGPLVDAGIPRDDADFYAEGVRRGGALVMVRTSDDRADNVADVMQRYNVVDIDQRMNDYRSSGWDRFDENATPYSATDIDTFRTSTTTSQTTGATLTTGSTVNTGAEMRNRDLDRDQEVLPVVEEQIDIGKRQVERGGVRVRSYMTETPVEEQVTLREERVNVERRAVDRPVTDADQAAFQERTIDVRETAEEAVVSKTARVVEEVVIDKDVRERTETVRDTVRRTDVDVENVDRGAVTSDVTTNVSGYDTFDNDFRTHYQSNFTNSGYTYDQFSPVYRYGYNLGADTRYNTGDWTTVEPEARRRWEERNPGTWEQFKDSVQYAWDRARGRR